LGARRPDKRRRVLTYVTRVLVPELGRGDIEIMDDLSSHKAPPVCLALESVGATLLFLRP
jgi:hypothetical protein